MALIKCSDCGKEVSDQAPTCPHCGRPMAIQAPQTPQTAQSTQPLQTVTRIDTIEHTSKRWKIIILNATLLGVLGVLMVLATNATRGYGILLIIISLIGIGVGKLGSWWQHG